MADYVYLALRYLHILFGIAWIGAVMYGVGALRRALPKIEMSARKETMKQLIPVMTQYIPGSAAMTIIFGFGLYLYLGQFDPAILVGGSWGRVLIGALILSLAALAIGILLGVLSAKKVLVHLNEESCTHGPEVGALQKRLNLSQFIALGLGLIIVLLMVVATTHAI